MIREAALAVAFVLFAAAAGSGDYPPKEIDPGSGLNDYELRISPDPKDSFKVKGGKAVCEHARERIKLGLIHSIPRSTPTECKPHPFFFTPKENCIEGFNC